MRCRGGIVTVPKVHILATLCRFDHIYTSGSYSGPFIPWERRPAYMEILRIQGRDFRAGFENREHGRPHDAFWSTLQEYH